jgi:hypothetical protein
MIRRPLFGFWLPFIGFRDQWLDAANAWDLFQDSAGNYRLFEVEWLWRGIIIGGKRIS